MGAVIIIILIIATILMIAIFLEKLNQSRINNNKDIDALQEELIKKSQAKIEGMNQIYSKKELLTKNEQYFFRIINNYFSDKYLVVPQVNLASILNKSKHYENEYHNELFRNIDFGIFDKKTTSPLLLIEINDKTHNEKRRQYRDNRVKEILNNANIKLVTFYTRYSNKEDYIINRIKENLVINEKSA